MIRGKEAKVLNTIRNHIFQQNILLGYEPVIFSSIEEYGDMSSTFEDGDKLAIELGSSSTSCYYAVPKLEENFIYTNTVLTSLKSKGLRYSYKIDTEDKDNSIVMTYKCHKGTDIAKVSSTSSTINMYAIAETLSSVGQSGSKSSDTSSPGSSSSNKGESVSE